MNYNDRTTFFPREQVLICSVAVLVFALLGLFCLDGLHADTVNYTYDSMDRLLVADYGGGKSFTYTYDKAGNILAESIGTSTGQSYTLQVSISPVGSGSVSGGGINCPGQCSASIQQNQAVSLTALPGSGFQFLGWGGGASGTNNPVTIIITAAKNAVAYFSSTSGSTDTDGVTDATEMGPGGNNASYDGNGDGIADYQQSSVASLPANAGGAYVTLSVPSGQTLVNVRSVDNPSPGNSPAGISFPYGFFEFAVSGMGTGGSTTVTLYLPSNTALNTYHKYGPTPDDHTSHWYQFMYDGTTGAEIFHEADRTRIVLHFRDGQRGDDDLSANGLIIDQGGPGQQPGAAIPTLNEWGMIFMSILLGGCGICFIYRRRAV
jgi:hypothetical protein